MSQEYGVAAAPVRALEALVEEPQNPGEHRLVGKLHTVRRRGQHVQYSVRVLPGEVLVGADEAEVVSTDVQQDRVW